MQFIHIDENGIHIVFGINEDNELKLLHFSHAEFHEDDIVPEIRGLKGDGNAPETRRKMRDEMFQPVQANLSGYNRPYERHGNKYIVTAPGLLFKFAGIEDVRNEHGRLLIIRQEDRTVTRSQVTSYWQFYDGTSIVRMWNVFRNCADETQTLEYLSSFSYTGIEKEGAGSAETKMNVRYMQHGWQKELTPVFRSFRDLGFQETQPTLRRRTSITFEVTNTGNWSTKQYLPIGYIENEEVHTALFFQIEHNGSWHYEIGDENGHYILNVSGPTEVQSHWFKELKPGEEFVSVPVAVGVCRDSFEDAVGELTKYRRLIRRPNADDENLPVIFNDYMNCLFGDPTTEKEMPMIDAAAKAGCEYYVIDCGWYSAGIWWDNVGEWFESRERFPEGLRSLTDYIRSRGMVPGLWLELEVMGIECELAKKLPDDWFFVRHGRRVYDRSRYQLDFRNPEVVTYADRIIDRLVTEYGAGYIKMDYNIEPGIGTELNTESVGQGLLDHERAYLRWLDGIFARYPDLVIENCSSGGLRMDYAMLSRYSIQSTSDQEDYRAYATIAANAAVGVTPEQAAVWSYPMNYRENGVPVPVPEEVIYNMVNALLLRIHQSGHLMELPRASVALVEEGLRVYKSIRGEIKTGLPFWPIGLANNYDHVLASGLKYEDYAYLAVWKRDDAKTRTIEIPLRGLPFADSGLRVEQIYPSGEGRYAVSYEVDAERKALRLTFEEPTMARLFRISKNVPMPAEIE